MTQQKLKKQQKPTTTKRTTTPRYRLYHAVVTNEGDPYNFLIFTPNCRRYP